MARLARLVRGLGLGLILILFASHASAESLLFLSTQLTPVDEADKMRRVILKGFPGEVDFQPNDNRVVFERLASEAARGSPRPVLLGGLHGDFVNLIKGGVIDPVDDVMSGLEDRGFIEGFAKLGKLGRDRQYYIPWMQATYVMVANRRALKYLPEDADLDSLTYDQLKAWAASMQNAEGEAKLGFPAGANGLIHRFFQGYLYPSYTGSTVRKFRGAEAEAMWRAFRDLWRHVNPNSLAFEHMDEPLLSGEVWVAWDHTARILGAFRRRPDDFVAFPVPAGPEGRGFMVVLAGLAIPKEPPNRTASIALIEHLTRPEVQLTTLRSVGFFPVVRTSGGEKLPPALALINDAVAKQAASSDALPGLLPAGLGEKAKEFNSVYLVAFSQIILRGKDIRSVLEKQARKLHAILSKTEARCWPPDEPSAGPCPVE
ncbi:MAG: extracellular solute-binding protein [Proteobacteria bacterium]|nr:extracellular solute-binding protein [Pseudomonadota bacterium]